MLNHDAVIDNDFDPCVSVVLLVLSRVRLFVMVIVGVCRVLVAVAVRVYEGLVGVFVNSNDCEVEPVCDGDDDFVGVTVRDGGKKDSSRFVGRQ
jgi:hypothetical protein